MVIDGFKELIEKEENVLNGVSALKKLYEEHKIKSSHGKQLFDEGQNAVFVLISLKKIPYLSHVSKFRISLPYPCWNDPDDTCLFVPDLNKSKPDDEATIHFYRILLQNHNANVREIITLHQLKTEYKTFESRRRLVGSFEIFLCDTRIILMMPKLLGKIFMQKRKMPVGVDLRNGSLGTILNSALRKTSLAITGHGSSSCCQVGNNNQSVGEIAKNVLAVLKEIENKLPGGTDNVSAVHIKNPRSIAVPLYMSFESANNVKLPRSKNKEKPVIDELTTDDATNVMIYPSGKIIDFKINEFGDILQGEVTEETEKRILRSVFAPKTGKRKRNTKKTTIKKEAISKKKSKGQKDKKMAKSAGLFLKSKKAYKLTEMPEQPSPSTRLLSVRKRDPEVEANKQENDITTEKNSKTSKRKLKGILKNSDKETKNKKYFIQSEPGEAIKKNLKKANEGKGILKKKKKYMQDAKLSSAERKTKKNKVKKEFVTATKKFSRIGKRV